MEVLVCTTRYVYIYNTCLYSANKGTLAISNHCRQITLISLVAFACVFGWLNIFPMNTNWQRGTMMTWLLCNRSKQNGHPSTILFSEILILAPVFAHRFSAFSEATLCASITRQIWEIQPSEAKTSALWRRKIDYHSAWPDACTRNMPYRAVFDLIGYERFILLTMVSLVAF